MHNQIGKAVPGKTFTLTTGQDHIDGDNGNDTVSARADTLSIGDQIDGGGGENTLVLDGAGRFDLSRPDRLKHIQTVTVQESSDVSGGVNDAKGDFIPSFVGTKSGDLDVLNTFATFDGTNYHIGGTMAAPIGTLPSALYVFGFNRGAATNNFAAIGLPNVLFDAVITMTGTGVVAGRDLAAGTAINVATTSRVISGSFFEITIPATLLPSLGRSFDQYGVNLWPRDAAAPAGNGQIADFAPNAVDFIVAPPTPPTIITLREGTSLTVNVTADPTGNPNSGVTIIGADNSDIINLASGHDTVILGSDRETVHGHGGHNVIQVNVDTIGATIDGGGGQSTLLVTANADPAARGRDVEGENGGGDEGGSNRGGIGRHDGGDRHEIIIMGNNITNIAIVKLDDPAALQLNAISLLDAIGSDGTDTIIAGGINQTLTGGAGADTLVGFRGGFDVFQDTASGLDHDLIRNFLASDRIDITNLGFAGASLQVTAIGADTMVNATSGAIQTSFTLAGSFSAAGFHLASDGALGTVITHS